VASRVFRMGNPCTGSPPVPGVLTPAQSEVEWKAQNAAAAAQKDRDDEAGKKLDDMLAKGKAAKAEAEAKAETEARAANPSVDPPPAGPDPDPDPPVMVNPDAGSVAGGPIVLTPHQFRRSS
jgi:hypothetical protein